MGEGIIAESSAKTSRRRSPQICWSLFSCTNAVQII